MRIRFLLDLRKISSKISKEKMLITEAVLFLVAARIGLVFLPFRRIVLLLNQTPVDNLLENDNSKELVSKIGWAVNAVANHLPIRLVCFPRGLAAHWMLQRRGLASTLYYGISRLPEKQLLAHVWVKHGGQGVVGCDNEADYAVLMHFPGQRGIN